MTDGPTDRLTWVGARDACASKNSNFTKHRMSDMIKVHTVINEHGFITLELTFLNCLNDSIM